MVRKIVTTPNEVLREPCQKVEGFDNPKVQAVIRDLKDTIGAQHDAAGLAAPQIGESFCMFAVNLPQCNHQIFVNPRITHFGSKKSLSQEACLSIPGKAGLVERANKVIIKAYDEQGNKFKLTAKGFLAQVLQHECEHLQGTLFIDKAEKVVE